MSGICSICNGESAALNYGAESCRACAAFFRRSVLEKRNYECVTGENSCELENSKAPSIYLKTFCRRCRFRKCLEAGMKAEDLNKRTRRKPDASRKVDASESRPSKEQIVPKKQIVEEPVKVKQIDLVETAKNFRKLRDLWRTSEEMSIPSLQCTAIEELPGKYMTTFNNYTRIQRSHQSSVMHFVVMNYPHFNEAPHQDQLELFRRFMLNSGMFLCDYRTVMECPEDKVFKYLYATELIVVDLSKMEDFVAETRNDEHTYEVCQKIMSTHKQQVMMMLKAAQLNDEEIAGLMGLFLWHNTDINISEETELICTKARGEIFHALEELCRRNGKHGLARVAEIMEIHNAVLQRVAQFAEDAQVLNIYGVFDGDSYIYDMLFK